MGEKKQYYDDQMTAWKCRHNPNAPKREMQYVTVQQQQQSQAPAQRTRFSQSDHNLPELVQREVSPPGSGSGGQSVNLRSHSDIRYHLNVCESNYYLDRQRTDAYRRELDEQIRERDHRRKLEKQLSNGIELAPLMTRKSPSLPKLPYLNSSDVTRPFNFSPRLTATSPMSPQVYHQELSSQQESRVFNESRLRQRDQEETHRHFDNWTLFWGRPGHGAPTRVHQHKKENLFKLLHYNINRK